MGIETRKGRLAAMFLHAPATCSERAVMDNKVNLSRYSCCRVDGYQGKLRDRGWPGCSSEQATVGRNAHIIDILRTGAPVNGIANVDWLSVRRSVATNCSVLP